MGCYDLDVNIKILNGFAKIPTRGSNSAAGWDLYAAIDKTEYIMPHSTKKIGTGLAMSIPHYTFGGIFPRSGLATKEGLRPANCVGVIDSDYRGEIIVALHNDTDEVREVNPGERIAQLIVMPYESIEFNVVEELDQTERGSSGFGDSGKF